MMIHFSLETEVQFSLLLTKNLLTSKITIIFNSSFRVHIILHIF